MTKKSVEEIGPWSEAKIRVVEEYAKAYSKVFAAKSQQKFHHCYIDAFAGAALKQARRTGELLTGSPLRVLMVKPRFREYHFIDIDSEKLDALQDAVTDYQSTIDDELPPIYFYSGDCNRILVDKVFPLIDYSRYRRALCFLDPYGLDVRWEVLEAAGQQGLHGTIDLLLNFSIMDLNRNALPKSRNSLTEVHRDRMKLAWGVGWEEELYAPTPEPDLFEDQYEKIEQGRIVTAYGDRLVHVAGFKFCSEPILFVNSKNAPLYYLLFASPNRKAAKNISSYLVRKYRNYLVT